MLKSVKLDKRQQKWLKSHKHKLGSDKIAEYLNISIFEVNKLIGRNEEVEDFKQKLPFENYFLVGILAVVFIVFSFGMGNGFVSDDIPGVVQNSVIASWSTVTSSIWGSLQNLIYYFVANVFGIVPWPFRIFSLTFHLASSALLYKIVRRSNSFEVAVLSLALFALSPLVIESVSWISGMPYVLGGMLAMWATYLHLDEKRTFSKNVLEIVAWFATMISIDKYIFLPLLFLWWDWKKNELQAKAWILACLLVVSFARGLNLISAFKTRTEGLVATYSNPGAVSLDNPIAKAIVSTGNYISLYLWPKELTLYHSEVDLGVLSVIKYGSVLLLFLLGIYFARKKNRDLVFWVAYFFVSLGVVLLPFRLSSLVSERYVYLGTSGLAVISAMVIYNLLRHYGKQKFFYSLLVGLIVTLSVRTILRIRDWKTADTLWFSAEKYSPSSWENHNNLGDAYTNLGNNQKAMEEFTKAIDLNPGYASAIHNRASAYQRLGRIEESKKGYLEAIKYNPNLWQSYLKLALMEDSQKHRVEAINYLRGAIKINNSPELRELLMKWTGNVGM